MIPVLFIPLSCNKDNSIDESVNVRETNDSDWSLPYTEEDWMDKVNGSLKLSQITIPGTHDTGADKHTSPLGFIDGPFAICQDYDIYDQLRLGVRWLDIRLAYENGDLRVHHAAFYLGKNFDYVLSKSIKFLNEHPSETVILMIKQEHTNETDKHFSDRVYDQIKKRGLDNFFIEDKIPTLDELRGKIFIVRRFNKSFDHPLGIYVRWPDNTKTSFQTYNGISYHVQDHFSLNTVSSKTKIDEIKSYIYRAYKQSNSNIFYLNFMSGERVATAETLWKTAEDINPEVQKYITDHMYRRHCGVILINFAGGGDHKGGRNCAPSLVKHILELNDGV